MAIKIVPSRTILLLLDLQVIHAKMLPNVGVVLDRTASVIKTARQKGIAIAHCRVAFSDFESANMPKTNFSLNQLSQDPQRLAIMNESSPETAFCPEVAPEKGDLVLRKSRIGLFLQGPTENLHAELKGRGIDTIVIGGVATGGAVLATVVQAADLDYQLVVLEDCCADGDKDLHETLMEKFFKKRGSVVKSNDLSALIDV